LRSKLRSGYCAATVSCNRAETWACFTVITGGGDSVVVDIRIGLPFPSQNVVSVVFTMSRRVCTVTIPLTDTE